MSWDADSQLIRTQETDGYNLALGEPFIVYDTYKKYNRYPSFQQIGELTYPHSEPIAELKQELERLYPGKHVVVTMGAKQALHAAVYALKSDSKIWVDGIYHRGPCWPTFSSIAALQGLSFQTSASKIGHITINSSPNNPDGTEDLSATAIWDASYASGAYGWSGKEPDHRISVWSAAKLFGCSGMRVGWMVTEDARLAKLAAAYVEMTTSGVPQSTQLFVAQTISLPNAYRGNINKEIYQKLEANAEEFLRLAPYIRDFTGFPLNNTGMFAWFQVQDWQLFEAALYRAKVKLLPGWACFDNRPGVYRMSLGQRTEVIREAITKLISELEK